MVKNKFRVLFLLLCISMLTWFSCKKETVVLPALSYNYFPVEKGRFVVYDVDSIYHSENDNNNELSLSDYSTQDDSIPSYKLYVNNQSRDLLRR